MPTYSRFPVVIKRGRGCWLWDVEGKKYLDFLSGISVNALGHCHPEIIKAVKKQIKLLFHTSNLYYTLPQIELAEELSGFSSGKLVFFSNSGAEANEAAIKLTRKYARKKKKKEAYKIISFEGSFHGRTLATLAATAQPRYHKDFEPLPEGFIWLPFNDLKEVENHLSSEVCGILVEPIQGEGGVRVAKEKFLKGLREICSREDIPLILDEVQCGLGRTGKLFAYQHWGIEPDILTLAKSIAGGLPMGITLASPEIGSFLEPGSHASTFGGNPVCCASALAFLKVLERENLLENVRRAGEWLKSRLEELKEEFPLIKEVRGKGLMLGMEIEGEAKKIVDLSIKRGLLLGIAGERVIRFLPPLIIGRKEIDLAVGILREALKAYVS